MHFESEQEFLPEDGFCQDFLCSNTVPWGSFDSLAGQVATIPCRVPNWPEQFTYVKSKINGVQLFWFKLYNVDHIF